MDALRDIITLYCENPDELTEAQWEALHHALETDPEAVALLREQLQMRELLDIELNEERRDFPAQVTQLVSDKAFSTQFRIRNALGLVRQRRRRRARLHRVLLPVSAAAAVALLLTAWVLHANFRVVARVQTNGEVRAVRGGAGGRVLHPEAVLFAGEELRTVDARSAALIACGEDNSIRLDGHGRLRVRRDAGARVIDVSRGALRIRFQSSPERPYLFRTPLMDVRVTGTRLRIAGGAKATGLSVVDGTVIAADRRGASEKCVAAGTSVVVSDAHKGLLWLEPLEDFESIRSGHYSRGIAPGNMPLYSIRKPAYGGEKALHVTPVGSERESGTYTVYRWIAAEGRYRAVAAGLTQPKYLDSGAPAGTASRYVVTTVDRAGNESAPSNPAAAKPGEGHDESGSEIDHGENQSDAAGASPASEDAVVEAPFLPSDVPGLLLWLDAETGVVTDEEGRVSRWTDLSGNANDLVQRNSTRQPVKTVDGDFAVVSFDGRDDTIRGPIGKTERRPHTVALAAKVRGPFGTYARMLHGRTGTGPGAVCYDGMVRDKLRLRMGYSGREVRGIVGELNQRYILTFVWNGEDSAMYVNGDLAAAGPALMPKFNQFALAGFSGFPQDVAELVMYNRALTDSERHDVERHLSDHLSGGDTTPPVPPGGLQAAAHQEGVALQWREPGAGRGPWTWAGTWHLSQTADWREYKGVTLMFKGHGSGQRLGFECQTEGPTPEAPERYVAEWTDDQPGWHQVVLFFRDFRPRSIAEAAAPNTRFDRGAVRGWTVLLEAATDDQVSHRSFVVDDVNLLK